MLAHTLMLLLHLLPAADTLPGDLYVQAPPATVLRAGPSTHHPGVLTLPAGAVLRRAAVPAGGDPPFVPVFVPQGFPVYIHDDFVEIDAAEQRVRVIGSRVNLRLLPATEGLLPIAQLADGGEPPVLQLLDVEGDWVRVLAPVEVPLFAAAETLAAADTEAAERWKQLSGTRWSRRQKAVAAFEATDPEAQARRELAIRIEQLTQVVLQPLDEPALLAHRDALQGLLADLPAGESREAVQAALLAVAAEQTRRTTAAATLADVERTRTREAAALVREARALDFGLRFEGKGEPLTVEGLVTRRSSEDSALSVYSIQDAAGRSYKLSAAKAVVDLPALVGKRVVIVGRTLALVNVDGMVLIVDKANPAERR